jgi:hypothetical protein
MQRTSLMLPPELQQQASQLARKRGISLGELIRQSLARELATAFRANADPFWTTIETFRSGRNDLAANHDDELYGPIKR